MLRLIGIAAVALAACSATVVAPSSTSPIPDASRQLLTVTTSGWDATDGRLHRWERVPGGPWAAVGEAVPVVVGRSGLGWGDGLHTAQAGPQKREGDGRAPAGAFRLTAAFGYAEAETTGLPYLAARASTQCVDDVGSAFYNLVLDSARVEPPADWSSQERMRRDDGLYRIGVVVAHNGTGVALPGLAEASTTPGHGSCIFLHVWRGAGTSTAGCTAMPDASLQAVLAWLDADAEPVLVQLPASEHARVAAAWGLPN